MNAQTAWVEILLAGFFAVACVKSWEPGAFSEMAEIRHLMRFPGRVERLRRSRWQWFSMVALMLVLRLQNQLPLILEMTVLFQFLLFMALPATKLRGRSARRHGNEAPVGGR